MSLGSRTADLYYSYRFIKHLTTPWEETDAYKLGLIDGKGKRIKSNKVDTPEEKTAYSPFLRMVYNIKRMLSKLPGGKTTMASYAAALFLLREQTGMTQSGLERIIRKSGHEMFDFIVESNTWFVIEDEVLAPGVYKLREDKLDSVHCLDIIKKGDMVRVMEDCSPVGEIFGMNVYKVQHINSNLETYISLGEIYR